MIDEKDKQDIKMMVQGYIDANGLAPMSTDAKDFLEMKRDLARGDAEDAVMKSRNDAKRVANEALLEAVRVRLIVLLESKPITVFVLNEIAQTAHAAHRLVIAGQLGHPKPHISMGTDIGDNPLPYLGQSTTPPGGIEQFGASVIHEAVAALAKIGANWSKPTVSIRDLSSALDLARERGDDVLADRLERRLLALVDPDGEEARGKDDGAEIEPHYTRHEIIDGVPVEVKEAS